jgi:hypothetical protein
MKNYTILTNRKRAVIALVHSIFFLGVASLQLAVSRTAAFSLHGQRAAGGVTLLAIYGIVSMILIWLVGISGCVKERLYFGLCGMSAAFGIVRTIFGDPVFHANLLRVLLLASAVLLCTHILRNHSMPLLSE